MPSDSALIEIVRVSLMIALKIMTPILLAGVLIGLIISILQSITSIQEQTLVFVPKIFAMLLVAIILLHWIVAHVGEFATEMFRLF